MEKVENENFDERFEASVAETIYSINKKVEREKKFREVAEVYERVVDFIKKHKDEINEFISENQNYIYEALFYPIYENEKMILHVEVWKSPFQHLISESMQYNRFYITVKYSDLKAFNTDLESYLLMQVRTQLGYNMRDVRV